MKKLGTLLLVSCLAACGGGNSSSGANPAPDWTAVGQALDGFVDPLATQASGKVKGYSFILFDRSGTLYTRTGGDHQPGTVDQLASASKMPAVAAILTLVDQNKLNLDTPVASYLQSAGNPISWPSDKAAITMRMLLSHTSGLPGLGDNQPQCLNNPHLTTLRACAQLVADAALVSQPGAEFNYGGADYQVAGYLAVVISGAADWESFFNTALAAQLGGIPSFTWGSALLTPNPRIAGGANSNAADYATILHMVLAGGVYNGKQVLSSAAIGILTRNEIAGLQIKNSPFGDAEAALYPGYTLGLFISDPSLHPGSPGPEYSDPGLTGATPWFDTGLGYGAVLLIDSNTFTGVAMWNKVRPLIIGQLN
jgi:CubicO group peptidase (beta-lactamase class C family)